MILVEPQDYRLDSFEQEFYIGGMSDHSAIEWTDATWNPVTGCTQLSPGCDHCYALSFAERFREAVLPALAAVKLALRGDFGMRGKRLGLMLGIAFLAALYSLWTLYGAGASAFWWSMVLFAAGLPVYFLMKSQRSGLPAVD